MNSLVRLLLVRLLLVRLTLVSLMIVSSWSALQAQITAPRITTASTNRLATLEEQLVNRLRATRDDQKAYIHFIVENVREEKLDTKLVIAIERYAMRRNQSYPFPFFERALRYEAAKRGVALPPVEHFASTRSVSPMLDPAEAARRADKERNTIIIRP